MQNPAKREAAMNPIPIVSPSSRIETAPDLLLEPEPESPLCPPNVPPVAAEPEPVPEAVWLMVLLIVDVLTRVGFWAPHGCCCRQLLEQELSWPQAATH